MIKKKIVKILFIGLIILAVIKYSVDIYKVSLFVKHGLNNGINSTIFALSCLSFLLIIGYYLSALIEKKYFKKKWEIDSSAGLIKVTNKWNINMHSVEKMFIDGEMVDIRNYTFKDYFNGTNQGRLKGIRLNKFGKENIIEGHIRPKYWGLVYGCDIYLNSEKIFSS